MTAANASEEDLLEIFPLTETELDVLLNLYETSYVALKSVTGHDVDLEEAIPELPLLFETAMQTVFVVGYENDDELARFLEASVSLCGRRGSRFLDDALFSAVDGSVGPLASLVFRLASTCHTTAHSTASQRSMLTPQSWIDLFSEIGGGENKEVLSRPQWREFTNLCLPTVHETLSTVFRKYFFGTDYTCLPMDFQIPKPDESLGSLFWNQSTAPISSQLALMDLGGKWRRIFCSELDGLSFRTFHEALISFCGPTLILIQTTRGEKLGYFTDVPWKSSPHWFTGEGDSFLFRLHPGWSVYKSTTTKIPKKHHQLLNPPVARRKDSLVGLAVGGIAADHPRLHITDTLERCKACSLDLVFESGPLLTDEQDHFFDVDILEVWSVRTGDARYQKAKEAGKLCADMKETHRQHCGSVDRSQFLDDFQTGVIPNTLYAHRDQARGRADFVADHKGRGYFVHGKEPSVRLIQHMAEEQNDP